MSRWGARGGGVNKLWLRSRTGSVASGRYVRKMVAIFRLKHNMATTEAPPPCFGFFLGCPGWCWLLWEAILAVGAVCNQRKSLLCFFFFCILLLEGCVDALAIEKRFSSLWWHHFPHVDFCTSLYHGKSALFT